MRSPRPVQYAVFLVLGTGLLLGGLEMFLALPLWWPPLFDVLPESLRVVTSRIYHDLDRSLIHDFSRYDPRVTYTLEPGVEARWHNREFDVRIGANRLGLRDDDASLEAPEVVVLGDSFAMGFGVEGKQAFPERLESLLGTRVLNAALESYGMARQVVTFNERLDRSKLRALIVQYCENDLGENVAFLRHGGELPISPEAHYRDVVAQHHAARRYWPGAYLRLAAPLWADEILHRSAAKETIGAEHLERRHLVHAFAFLAALSRLEIGEPFPRIVVLDLWDPRGLRYLRREDHREGLRFDSRLFLSAVQALLAEWQYPAFLEKLELLDTSTILDDTDRFRLDGHLRPAGHDKIARAPVEILENRRKPFEPVPLLSSRAERARIVADLTRRYAPGARR